MVGVPYMVSPLCTRFPHHAVKTKFNLVMSKLGSVANDWVERTFNYYENVLQN